LKGRKKGSYWRRSPTPIPSPPRLLPPETTVDEEDSQERLDPSHKIWSPSSGISPKHGIKPTTKTYTTTGASLPPPPSGIAAGEGFRLTRGEEANSQGGQEREPSREGEKEVQATNLKLKLFGFSLRGRAKDWSLYVPTGAINSWDNLKLLLRNTTHMLKSCKTGVTYSLLNK
jgi:hypothetical protein